MFTIYNIVYDVYVTYRGVIIVCETEASVSRFLRSLINDIHMSGPTEISDFIAVPAEDLGLKYTLISDATISNWSVLKDKGQKILCLLPIMSYIINIFILTRFL